MTVFFSYSLVTLDADCAIILMTQRKHSTYLQKSADIVVIG